jgi:hypothetical protein
MRTFYVTVEGLVERVERVEANNVAEAMAEAKREFTAKEADMYAVRLRSGKWAVRPKGQLGTCGWYPYPWNVVYVTARNEQEAIRKAGGK